MAHAAHRRFAFAEYLLLEEDSRTKHEFMDGQVWAMAGGSPERAGISMNVGALLNLSLRGQPCRTFSSDLRVRAKKTGLATYPDITVVCGALEFDPDDAKQQTVINPRVIIEVLSPSTEDYDRGEKLGHYKTIDSVVEVVFVAHDRREIEVVRRESDGSWSRQIFGQDERAQLTSLGCELPLDEVYRNPLA